MEGRPSAHGSPVSAPRPRASYRSRPGAYLHDGLGDGGAVGAADFVVIDGDDVEHHGIVGAVGGVAVAVPVGGPDVHLHVSAPCLIPDFHGGVEEVGPGVGVEPPGVYHAQGEAACCCGAADQAEAVLPDELH